MNKKIKIIAIIAILLTISGCQRHELGIFAELVIFPEGGCGNNERVYYYVVKNNGTLILYSGVSRNRCHLTSGYVTSRNLMRSVRRREEIKLNEQDFQIISELVNDVVENYNGGGSVFLGRMHITLLHEGGIYGNATGLNIEFHYLRQKLVQLIPFNR